MLQEQEGHRLDTEAKLNDKVADAETRIGALSSQLIATTKQDEEVCQHTSTSSIQPPLLLGCLTFQTCITTVQLCTFHLLASVQGCSVTQLDLIARRHEAHKTECPLL